MAIIGSFGMGQVDLGTESLLGSLESSGNFTPSFGFGAPAFGAPAFSAPSYQIGANPMMQILPMLLTALTGLGQGWAGVNGQQQSFGPAPQQFRGNASHCQ